MTLPTLTSIVEHELPNHQYDGQSPVEHRGDNGDGTEFCGRPDKHDYQLFLAINDIPLGTFAVQIPCRAVDGQEFLCPRAFTPMTTRAQSL